LSNSGQLVNSLYELDTDTNSWRTLGPMQIPRSNAAIAFLDGAIYVMGGEGANGLLASVERYDLATGRWTLVAPLPEPLVNLGAATVGSAIHVLFEHAHYVYSPEHNEWTRAVSMNRPRHAFGMASIGKRLFVIGGCDPEPEDTGITEVLDLEGGS
jgi:N-acetylneuraminic acid mutarotase